MFPERRMRRLRSSAAMRELVAETRLSCADLIAPFFVKEGIDKPSPISSLPGVGQHSIDSLVTEAEQLLELGIPGLILFGIPVTKDATGSQAFDENGIVQLALKELKAVYGSDLVLIADLCVDEYTDHGHCGVLDATGDVDNDQTLELYARIAVAQARAGATVVAPSGMMDGQVGRIRAALDQAGFEHVAILAYSAKYASAFYGPFRDAVEVAIAGGGDRKRYQQDFRNTSEAMTEIAADIDEGADMVMIKPGLAYLDIVAKARSFVDVPIGVYQVSGEYSMIKAAGDKGWVDPEAVLIESLTAIKRAGADFVLTYAAVEAARWLRG